MPRSALQERAETAAARFRESGRPAIVVEFAGLPKAGKTSTLSQVYSFLRRCGFRCEIIVERASVCPIRDKKHFNFNVWTACTSIAQLLEKTQNPPNDSDPDILFLDRGIFDSLCWFSLLEQLGRIRPDDRRKLSEFLLVQDWTSRITGVIAMTANPKEALSREQGELPVEGLEGSIMNPTILKRMDRVLKDAINQYRDDFRIYAVNTSSKRFSGLKKTSQAVVNTILNWIEDITQENILSLPRNELPTLNDRLILTEEKARNLVSTFESCGDYKPRRKVESDKSRIQPLPVVVVRNRSGHVLQLIRKERDPTKELHKKIQVWAGGHVRKQDSVNGHSIAQGAIRELQEELRLYVRPSDLRLLGAVYVEKGERTGKHIAIVYEWRAPNDDVEITLARSEFFEKGGSSLRGKFLPPDKVSGEEVEPWSQAIVSELLRKAV